MGIVIDLPRRTKVPQSYTLIRETGAPSIDAINALTDLDRAWMAGFFDGEGSIGLYRKMKDGQFYAVTTRITIAQTGREQLDQFFKAFGGAMVLIDRPARTTVRHTQYWTWTCDAVANASLFLQALRPWLRTKADEADIVMEYINNRYTYTLAEKETLIGNISLLKTRITSHMDSERSAQIRAMRDGTEG